MMKEGYPPLNDSLAPAFTDYVHTQVKLEQAEADLKEAIDLLVRYQQAVSHLTRGNEPIVNMAAEVSAWLCERARRK